MNTSADAAPLSADDAPHAARAPVSVVIPCFRCTDTIDDAIASVLAQTLRPAEVLLVEDCSGDATLASLQRIAARHDGWIKVIAMPVNGGPSRARNAGWDAATQPYIAFLDADDRWAPQKLALQMAAFEADEGLALVAHRMLKRPRGTPFPIAQAPPRTQPVGRYRLLFHNPFPTASVVLCADLPFRFDPDVWHSEDYLLWSRIVFSGHRCAKIDQVLAIWNERENGAVGLSDDVEAIHRARRTMRRTLFDQGLISGPEYLGARMIGVASWWRRRLAMRLHRDPGVATEVRA
ncbi:MAG TPA: glycosyltransferase family 2 protein [Luteimonas sp.]|nr:glycosyltransferase family 2 protein [Luteimonas sp.]